MKIKRFEASSMSDALRMIKKEFGEEAVILSAKTIRKNSILGKQKGVKVVVTAAIDRTPVIPVSEEIGLQASPPAANAEIEEQKLPEDIGGINILKRFNPITPTGQKKVKPKIVQLMNAEQEQSKQRYLFNILLSQGISEDIAVDMEFKAAAILSQGNVTSQEYVDALTQIIDANGLTLKTFSKKAAKPRIMVLMGPCGVGKTSTAVKLCTQHTLEMQESVGLISFDNQRAAGTVELERYARILGAPFKTIFDPDAVNAAINEMAAYDLVIIDTPGFAAEDRILCEQIRRLVSALNDPERYLLINADAQEKAMARIIAFSRPLEIQRLIFTKLDWIEEIGPMVNQAVASNLPIAYLSNSTKVPEGIKVATAHELTRRIMRLSEDPSTLTDDPAVTVVQSQNAYGRDTFYVANRNSDIFHLNTCKSVQRINTDHMIAFKNPSEAMGRQFKPCRMCCNEMISPKPVDRLARGYAGHRYYHQ